MVSTYQRPPLTCPVCGGLLAREGDTYPCPACRRDAEERAAAFAAKRVAVRAAQRAARVQTIMFTDPDGDPDQTLLPGVD